MPTFPFNDREATEHAIFYGKFKLVTQLLISYVHFQVALDIKESWPLIYSQMKLFKENRQKRFKICNIYNE